MPRKVTASAIKAMAEELLNIQVFYERYKELEQAIKAGLTELKYTEMQIPKGRVFISTSERVTISATLAREILGPFAEKVIVKKEIVPNDVIGAFVKAGEISEEKRDRLLFEAEKTRVISLHVRPLK